MSDKKLFGMPAETGRWIFVVLGFIINICLGSVYAYSVFAKPVRALLNVSATEAGLPFMVFLAFFATLVFVGGQLIGKLGPRNLGILGGVILGLGWMAASQSTSIMMLAISYGAIGGGGVGLAYGVPLAVVGRWFPDKRGLALGLTLAGFGGSPFVSANVAVALIKAVGPMETFLYLGAAFLVIVCLLFIPFRYPEEGWKPAGWTPPAAAGGGAAAVDFNTAAMIKTPSFYGLFLCYVIGCLAGLMAIGISSPVAQEIIKINAATAATLVGVFAIFNGVGRPLFGTLTDKLSPRMAAIISYVIILLSSLGMLMAGEGSVMLYVICFIGFWLCLGGWLAIAPTATTTFFGVKNYAKNYGVVYFAYGVGAILGGIISGQAKDTFGSYAVAFYPTAGLAVVGIIIAFLLLKPPKK
ncbi:MAG TPA: OFA family MFS transporter [Syntrophales bacterium]|nr:OFA family MFS transporter [Syntrophales bacterium]HON23383.1 OFA family MFS transporter [Syntrophales bacterium]HOU77774.1 OFA family MFS transporter [Syntrophales bacterium]HPC32873.1 OFA family MFS transporter [Syntrophales bacterium]HQG34923.1 OFA family MFS transporter [Syntrophales bacterium]